MCWTSHPAREGHRESGRVPEDVASIASCRGAVWIRADVGKLSLSYFLNHEHKFIHLSVHPYLNATDISSDPQKALFSYPQVQLFLRRTAFPSSRSEHLKRLRFYYVFFLGTLHSARGRGLGGAVMTHVQTLASQHTFTDPAGKQQTGVPIYFECSLEKSRLFYEHLGFKAVCMVRVGRGEVDESGRKVEMTETDRGTKAAGVRLWAMVWWPEGMWPEGVQYWDGVEEMDVN